MKFLFFIILFSVCRAFAGDEEGLSLYEDALFLESAERKFDMAIEKYEAVINSAKDPKLKAKAYLRMAICQERLGNIASAKQALEDLLAGYPESLEEAAYAKSILKRMEEDVQKEIMLKIQQKSVESIKEEVESEVLSKVAKQQQLLSNRRYQFGFYGGISYIRGSLFLESKSAGAQFDINIKQWLAAALEAGVNFEHKRGVDLNTYKWWIDSDNFINTLDETILKEESTLEIKYIIPKLLFKVPLSRNISQILGCGAGLFRIREDLRIAYSGSTQASNGFESTQGLRSARREENVEGYVVPFGWELSQNHFGASLLVEYMFINTGNLDNLKLLTPRLTINYRF